MTHDILQSDIELAVRLKEDQRSDEEIMLALTQRRVDPEKAAQLVDDLRKGIKPSPKSAIPLEFTLGRRSRPRGISPGEPPDQPTPPPAPKPRTEPRRQPAVRSGKSPTSFRLPIVIIVGLLVTVICAVLIQRYKARNNDQDEPQPKPAMPKADQAAPAQPVLPATNASSGPLILELQPDGLHLGGALVTGGNVLAAVNNLLGVPSRTNQVKQTDTVIYAYDQHGLLIYCPQGGGTNRIVLDCDASGGDNGTTAPFAGALKVEDQMIGPATDSQTLAAIKSLGLNRTGTGGTFLGGNYHGLDLVFAYLNSPQRPSLISIDLK